MHNVTQHCLIRLFCSVNADKIEHAALRKIASQHANAQKYLSKLSSAWAAQLNVGLDYPLYTCARFHSTFDVQDSPGQRDLESAIEKVNASDENSVKHSKVQGATTEPRRRVQSVASASTMGASKASSRSGQTKNSTRHDGWTHVPGIMETLAREDRAARALDFPTFEKQLATKQHSVAPLETGRRASVSSVPSIDTSATREKRNATSAITRLAHADPVFKVHFVLSRTCLMEGPQ